MRRISQGCRPARALGSASETLPADSIASLQRLTARRPHEVHDMVVGAHGGQRLSCRRAAVRNDHDLCLVDDCLHRVAHELGDMGQLAFERRLVAPINRLGSTSSS